MKHRDGTQEAFGHRTRWLARLALFALIFQIAALGHWGGGKLSPEEQARHARHCHGESAACSGGLSSAVAELVPVAGLPRAPVARVVPTGLTVSVLQDAVLTPADEPPRA
jgi:hypothetical protein